MHWVRLGLWGRPHSALSTPQTPIRNPTTRCSPTRNQNKTPHTPLVTCGLSTRHIAATSSTCSLQGAPNGIMVDAEMCKLFLGNINPDLTPETLHSQVSALVQDVGSAEVHIKTEKDGRKTASGVVRFATWSSAARAKSRLLRHHELRLPLGGRTDYTVRDYREKELDDSKGLMFCACFMLIVVPLGIFFSSGLSLNTEQPMIAFTEQPVDYLNANVLSSGVSYTCGDHWGGTPSIECVDERACTGTEDQLHPTRAEVAAVESLHHPARELRCKRVFTPWLKVMLRDGQDEKVRCAYKYGTRANSQFMKEDSRGDADDFIAAHPMGSGLRVWALPTPGRCLVGVADLKDLASATKSRTGWVVFGVGLAVFAFGLCFLVSVAKFATALRIPTEPPRGGAAMI